MTRRNPFVFAIPLVFLMAVALLPYVWILLASFKTRTDLISRIPKWFFEPTGINYSDILYKGFDAYLLNSVIIGFSSTALTVAVGTLAAYGFSRFKIPAGNHLFFYILATRLGPPVAYALPMYLIFNSLGLVNSYIGVILAHATFNLVLVVWMMRSFFDDVPREIGMLLELVEAGLPKQLGKAMGLPTAGEMQALREEVRSLAEKSQPVELQVKPKIKPAAAASEVVPLHRKVA